jgi:hypothetical protein
MRLVDKRTKLTRRGFMSASTATALGAAGLAGARVLIDPQGAWAMSLSALQPDTAATLLRMARDIYPHDRLADAFYAKAIEPYDAAAAKDASLKELLEHGVATLDAAARQRFGKAYAEIPAEADRVALLRSIEGDAFFQKVRGDLISALYNQPELWTKFGYEGPSAPEGGYIERGFGDIDWLEKA